MSHASRSHREFDCQFYDALAKDGAESDHGHRYALLPSRLRGKDARAMNGPPQARVLFAVLSECTSGRGTTYLRGWAGASNLIAFRGEDDEQGRPTWQLYLTERQPRDGSPAPRQRASERGVASASPGATGARPDGTARPTHSDRHPISPNTARRPVPASEL